MFWGARLFLAAALWLGALRGAVAAESPVMAELGCPQDSSVGARTELLTRNSFTPGISWEAWRDLLKASWSDEDAAKKRIFSADEVMATIKWALPGEWPPPQHDAWGDDWGNHTVSQTYNNLATGLQQGVTVQQPTYDKIMAELPPRTAAEALYNTARMNLNLGRYAQAFKQIEKILSEPSMQDMHQAALALIGTRAYQSASPVLAAAHYAEIRRRLTMPHALACDQTFIGSDRDAVWYTGKNFRFQRWVIHSPMRPEILEVLAKHDTFYDLIRTMGAITPYDGAGGWLMYAEPAYYAYPEQFGKYHVPYITQREFLFKDTVKFTEHAREEWRRTHNILWGYALARRTPFSDDLPLLKDMLASLDHLPNTPAIRAAQPHLRNYFIRHAIRIMLLAKQLDAALQFLHENPVMQSQSFGDSEHADDADIILSGGIRLFLERFDLDGARRWAEEAGRLLDRTPIPNNLRPLLANSFEELLDNKVPGDGRANVDTPDRHDDFPFEITDLLPRKEMLRLVENPKLGADGRRALVGTAFVRAYLLGDWRESMQILPALARSFPELRPDIESINGAWLDQSKQHQMLLMILRTPGLRIRAIWAEQRRHFSDRLQNARQQSLHDPNDQNWWCPVKLRRVEYDMMYKFFLRSIDVTRGYEKENNYYKSDLPERQSDGYGSYTERKYTIADVPDTSYAAQLMADKIIAWHPLLKQVRMDELRLLAQAPSAPRLLTQQVLDWAKQSNAFTRFLGLDNDLPEALHRAIKVTHFGCRRNGGHGDYSYAAYRVLHNRYPQSIWAAKTPYWYNITPRYREQ